MNAVADTLNRAADLIERDGWCQGLGRDADGSRCAAVALHDAQADRLVWRGAYRALKARVGTRLVVDWNDTPGRTQAEVVAALRAAADAAA